MMSDLMTHTRITALAVAEAIATERARAAKLVLDMMDEAPWKDRMWARAALTIAAHAIDRGRHFTAREKLLNLASAMDQPGENGENFHDLAEKLRTIADPDGSP